MPRVSLRDLQLRIPGFSSDVLAPLTRYYNTFSSETPQVGTHTIVDTNSVWSVAGGILAANAAPSANNNPRFVIDQIATRASGVAFIGRVRQKSGIVGTVEKESTKLAIDDSVDGGFSFTGMYFRNASVNGLRLGIANGNLVFANAPAANTWIKFAVVLLNNGGWDIYLDREDGRGWRHRWRDHTNLGSTNLRAYSTTPNAGGTYPSEFDWLWFGTLLAPFNSDYGPTIQRVANPASGTAFSAAAHVNTSLYFTLPASPTGNMTALRYEWRKQDDQHLFAVEIVRNAGNTAWDLHAIVVDDGTVTPTVFTNIGNVVALQIQDDCVDGLLHRIFSHTTGWAFVGNLSNNNDVNGSGVALTYHASTTVTDLIVIPETSAQFSALDVNNYF